MKNTKWVLLLTYYPVVNVAWSVYHRRNRLANSPNLLSEESNFGHNVGFKKTLLNK